MEQPSKIQAVLNIIAEVKEAGGKPPTYEQFRQAREEQATKDAEKLKEVRKELEVIIGC